MWGKVLVVGIVAIPTIPVGKSMIPAKSTVIGSTAVTLRAKGDFVMPANNTSIPDETVEVQIRSIFTREDIIQELLDRGVPLDKMRIPGKVPSHILYIADDFNDSVDGFEDYM